MSESMAAAYSDCDVVVIGSGVGGLVTALVAAEAGLSVLVLEKASQIGGTTAYSEAMVWAPCSAQAQHAGISDSPDEALRYLVAAGGDSFNARLGQAYVHQAAEALRFVEDHSSVRYELTSGSIDYYPELPGATHGARALTPLPFDGRRLGRRFNILRAPLATTMIFGGMSVIGPDLKHFYKVGRSLKSTLVAGRLFARYVSDRLRGYQRGTLIAGGNGVLAGLLLALDRHGVRIVTNACAKELLTDMGRVCGVRAEIRPDHAARLPPEPGDLQRGSVNSLIVNAARGVVLATGGFPRRAPLVHELYAHVAQGKQHWTLAPQTNEGDGLAMAEALGASFNREVREPAAWTPVSLVRIGQETIPFPHFSDRAKPGVIAVDRRGARFVNEAVSYHDFVPAMVSACRSDQDVEVFLVADTTAQRKYGLGASPPFPGRIAPHVKSGYLTCAPTLAELATAIGIEPNGLCRTVATFNAAARHGRDPFFGKGTGAYDRANGDPTHSPNPCVAPLETPPYFAVRVVPGDLGTFAGLRTDEHARVLHQSGDAILGLYAVGSDMASAMGGAYPGAGVAVGSAMTFGYIAARHLAAAH